MPTNQKTGALRLPSLFYVKGLLATNARIFNADIIFFPDLFELFIQLDVYYLEYI
jgi:hypothetical protein